MQDKPLFSVVAIAKNEAKVLPRLLQSLEEFKRRGGTFYLVDTGSSDDTVRVAREWGAVVKEVGAIFVHEISEKQAKAINDRFIVENEIPVVNAGDRYFDFASARNEVVSISEEDFVCTVDCDEIFTRMDIDKINEIIRTRPEVAHFEYNFVFSHTPDGGELIKFIQSKFYDRRKMHWVGIIHEILQPIAAGTQPMFLDESIYKLEHWQNPETNRGQYLRGLAVDCFEHQEKDRNSHYFARELWWTGRPFSAYKEFLRHVNMNAWPAERAESMLFMSDICGAMGGMKRETNQKEGKPSIPSGKKVMEELSSDMSPEEMEERQLYWAHRALDIEPTRREPLMKLSQIYARKGAWTPANFYATAALELPWHGFYGSNIAFYTNEPHEILFQAKGWLGDIEGAKKHLLKCLDYQRENPWYLFNTRFYFDYADPQLPGWMTYKELLFLFETARQMESVIELGSWKGKSTHAICSSGCPSVTAIDHWKGSEFEPEAHAEAKSGSVFETFKNNTKDFKNLTIKQADINEAVKDIPDKSVDMVFLDAGHTYEEVRNDIRKWKNKAKIVLCGHDYVSGWPGVMQAVNEELGGYDELYDTIWVKWLVKPFVSVCVPTLGRPEKLERLLSTIRENAGYDNYEIIVEADQMPPNNVGCPTILKRCVNRSKGELVLYLGNDCVPQKDFLKEAVWEMARRFPGLDGLVGLNDGYWDVSKGAVATHWLASKKLLSYLDGEFFHTGYFHTGCDNELQARCEQIGKFSWAKKAMIYHDHPINNGFTSGVDELYAQAYGGPRHEHDDKLYAERAKKYGFDKRKWVPQHDT